MAKDVVKHVGFLQIIELMRLADEMAGRETPVGQVFKKNLVGHQAGHGHQLPAGALHQDVGHAPEVGNAVGPDRQRGHAANERVAGAPRQQPALALEQRFPDAVLFGGVPVPALVNGPVGSLRALGVARCKSVFACFF